MRVPPRTTRPGAAIAALVAVLAVQVLVTLTVVSPLAAGGLPRWLQVLVVALVSVGLRVLLGAAVARRVLAGGGTGTVAVRSVALGAVAGYLLTVLAGWVLVEAPGSAGGWLGELTRTVVGLAVTVAPFAAGARWQAVRSEAPAAVGR